MDMQKEGLFFKLRDLQEKDIPLMLEWMQAPDVNDYFRFGPEKATPEAVELFIENSRISAINKHFAIADDSDEYLGTISLKNIDYTSRISGFAMALRPSMRGKGAGTFAIGETLKYAFGELNLRKVYLDVYSDNIAAIRLYEKVGFTCDGEFKEHIFVNNKYRDLKWFSITKDKYDKQAYIPKVSDVKEIQFAQLGDMRGKLVVIEGGTPFDIKRVFYIYGSDSSVVRGQHANKYTDFILINVSGTSKVKIIDIDNNSCIIDLNEPHSGVYIPHMLWKDMYDFSGDSVLLVLASTHYDGAEYIRDFNEFLKMADEVKQQ